MRSSESKAPTVPDPSDWKRTRKARDGKTLLLLAVTIVYLCYGCDQLLTTTPDSADLFDAPLDGLTAAELAAFVEGDEQFGKPFSPKEGLGPIFNNVSCASCHSGDGRGRLENQLVRFSIAGNPAIASGGPQIQDKAIPGAVPEQLPAGAEVSHRLPPPVFGLGLVEAIPEAAILAFADETDANGDGISGRPNYVVPPEFATGGTPSAPVLGRLSRKAQVTSLLVQTVAAYHQDIGITTDFLPDENTNPLASHATEAADRVADPELAAAVVRAVVAYLRMLAPPAPGERTASRDRGEALFSTIGCAGCHVPTYTAGPSPIPSIDGRAVTLYSDLLLHDMGDGLADYRPDGLATGHEWRTTPLWGLRVSRDFLNGDLFLLHDGRASTVEEAIRLHGGEATAARDSFVLLSTDDRAALLDFVESR